MVGFSEGFTTWLVQKTERECTSRPPPQKIDYLASTFPPTKAVPPKLHLKAIANISEKRTWTLSPSNNSGSVITHGGINIEPTIWSPPIIGRTFAQGHL